MSITVVEPAPRRRAELIEASIPTLENQPPPNTSDVVILAIPPQTFLKFVESNPAIVKYQGIIISVMAGISIQELTTHLESSQVYRAIPNLGCSLNQGMTVLISALKTTHANDTVTNELFSKLGNSLSVNDEKLLDSATALVGGGPAYTSYFAAALIEYATTAGFDKASATSITLQVLRSTCALLEQSKEPPMRLCERVMTRGGTTQRAIEFFNHMQLRDTIVEGLKRSCIRSIELGRRE